MWNNFDSFFLTREFVHNYTSNKVNTRHTQHTIGIDEVPKKKKRVRLRIKKAERENVCLVYLVCMLRKTKTNMMRKMAPPLKLEL
jgi:hypothetical protein